MFWLLCHFLPFLTALINEIELLKGILKTYFRAGIYFLNENQIVVKISQQRTQNLVESSRLS